MAAPDKPRTPIGSKADRSDPRVRLIEEAVLLIRGEWPAAACGLCETVNRETGLIIAAPGALDRAIGRTADEAMRLVEALYGGAAAEEIRRLAAAGGGREADSAAHGVRRRGGRLGFVARPRRLVISRR